jgi:hypothetical protein
MTRSTPKPSTFRDLLARHGRILTFRATAADYDALGLPDLAWGLMWVWLAGVGRGWDHPQMEPLRRSGLGSVLYVCLLALLLMVVLAPLLPPRQGSLWRILPFLTLTAPPALLYALPLERGLDLGTATTVNFWLLALVAGWRVAMYVFFLRRGLGFSPGLVTTGALLPLMGVVTTLAALNLDRAVFEIMSSGEQRDTVHDGAYAFLVLLVGLSWVSIIPVFLVYVGQVVNRWNHHLDTRKPPNALGEK